MTGQADLYDKSRAVVLAALMVVSVFGGTMAFAGTAAATVDSASLNDSVVQPSDDVTVSGSYSSSDDIYIVADKNTNGNYDSSEDALYRVPDGDVDSDAGTFETSISVSDDLNLADGDSVDIYAHQSSSEPSDSLQVNAGTLTVDGAEPSVENLLPADGAVVNSKTQEISATITDDESANADLTISVNIETAAGINTYEINPESSSADGVTYDSGTGELTITPGSGEVPELAEGQVDVTIEAKDVAGNVNTTSFSFDVDRGAVTSSFEAPGDNLVTSDVNETVTVSLASEGSAIADDTVSLEITGPGDYSQTFDYESAQYTNDTNTFSVTPDMGETVPSFTTDGEYSVTVTGESEAGNPVANTNTYNFDVDTTGPSVDSVVVDETAINSNDLANDVNVTVTFTEPEAALLDASSVEAELLIDGQSIVVDDFVATSENVVEAPLNEELAQLGAVENNSVVVNVTAAEDTVGNAVQNPDASASKTTEFEVDTDGPSVSLDGTALANAQPFSGYMNVSSFIASTDDVSSTNVEIYVGQEPNAAKPVSEPKDVDTTEFADGKHTVAVTVFDEAGNTQTATADFTLDNGDATTVQQKYLPGTSGVYEVVVGSDVNLSTDVFDASSGTYTIDDGSTTKTTKELDVSEYNNGQNLDLSVDGVTVDVEVKRIEIASVEAVDSNGNQVSENPEYVEITFADDTSVETLNATVEATDSYDSTTVSLDDFQLVEGSQNVYVAEVPSSLRDGQFQVTIDKVTTATQTLEPTASTGSFAVDYSEPTPVDADLVFADENGATAKVTFDQPIDAASMDSSIVSIEDSRVAISGVRAPTVDGVSSDARGSVYVDFGSEPQTADMPNVTFDANSVGDEFGSNNTDNTEAVKIGVNTIELSLSEGANTVSIPAWSGSVDIETLDLSGVKAIWAYDDGKWSKYTNNGQDDDTLTALEGGQGYVVYASEHTELDVNAENVPSDGDSGAQAISSERLEAGWNFVGAYQEGSQSIQQAFAPLGDTTYSVQKGYTGEQVDTLEGGQGYWLFVEESGAYHAPVSYTGMSSEQPNVYNVEVTDDSDGNDVVDGTNKVKVSAEVEDDSNLQSVYVDASAFGGSSTLELTNGGSGAYTATFAPGSYDGKSAELRVTAVDTDSNIGYGYDAVTVDNTVEVNSIDATASGSDITVTVTDDEPLDTSSFTVANVDGKSAGDFSEVDNGDANLYEYEATISGVSDGDYTVDVTNVADSFGNSYEPSVDVGVTVETPPDAQSVQYVNSDSDNEMEEITITYNEDVSSSNPEVGDYSLSGTNSGSYTLDSASVSGDTVTISVTDNTGDSSINSDLTLDYDASAGTSDSITDGTTPAESFTGKDLTAA
jgi:surface glycoprotein (TIGR04207 family)